MLGVVLVSSRRSLAPWIGGLATAISAIAAVALVARLVPGSFPGRDLDVFLPAAATRLSFPLGYWNGLAIFVALGVPLLLSLAVVSRDAVSSRTGAGADARHRIGDLPRLFARCGRCRDGRCRGLSSCSTDRRWTAVAALATSALGSLAAIAVLLQRDELVNGPLGTDLVERQGRSAALLIATRLRRDGPGVCLRLSGAPKTGDELAPAPAVAGQSFSS